MIAQELYFKTKFQWVQFILKSSLFIICIIHISGLIWDLEVKNKWFYLILLLPLLFSFIIFQREVKYFEVSNGIVSIKYHFNIILYKIDIKQLKRVEFIYTTSIHSFPRIQFVSREDKRNTFYYINTQITSIYEFRNILRKLNVEVIEKLV